LPREDFIDCLHDLFFASESSGDDSVATKDFKSMLYARYGRGICEKFLFPYNEKLYACDLATLDPDAMGRFFPRANLSDVVRNMKTPDNRSYNSTFIYPSGGAIQFVRAISSEVRTDRIACDEPLVGLDVPRRRAITTKREIAFDHMISSIPLVRLAEMAGLPDDSGAFSWNKVLVFNLGFDRKGPRDVHWLYFPERSFPFYRVGFYDNILDGDRMSLYVEIGLPRNEPVDLEHFHTETLRGLRAARILTEHQLVAWHSVVLDPAYVHITPAGIVRRDRTVAALRQNQIHSVGRYGGWTYCSIEDNILEARRTVREIRR
jgi:protoporphyrinogen oxidase